MKERKIHGLKYFVDDNGKIHFEDNIECHRYVKERVDWGKWEVKSDEIIPNGTMTYSCLQTCVFKKNIYFKNTETGTMFTIQY